MALNFLYRRHQTTGCSRRGHRSGNGKEISCVDSAELGKASRIVDAAGRYIEFCKATFPNELSLSELKIVVDCANGATYHIAPNVLRELGANVIAIGCEPNGVNINAEVGATDVRALQARVLAEKRISVLPSTATAIA